MLDVDRIDNPYYESERQDDIQQSEVGSGTDREGGAVAWVQLRDQDGQETLMDLTKRAWHRGRLVVWTRTQPPPRLIYCKF